MMPMHRKQKLMATLIAATINAVFSSFIYFVVALAAKAFFTAASAPVTAA